MVALFWQGGVWSAHVCRCCHTGCSTTPCKALPCWAAKAGRARLTTQLHGLLAQNVGARLENHVFINQKHSAKPSTGRRLHAWVSSGLCGARCRAQSGSECQSGCEIVRQMAPRHDTEQADSKPTRPRHEAQPMWQPMWSTRSQTLMCATSPRPTPRPHGPISGRLAIGSLLFQLFVSAFNGAVIIERVC